MLRKLVIYNSQNYAGTLGSGLEAGSINPSINRSYMVQSCSALGCANRDTKENCIKDIRFFRILVNYENWRLWLVAIGRKILILHQMQLFAVSFHRRQVHAETLPASL